MARDNRTNYKVHHYSNTFYKAVFCQIMYNSLNETKSANKTFNVNVSILMQNITFNSIKHKLLFKITNIKVTFLQKVLVLKKIYI